MTRFPVPLYIDTEQGGDQARFLLCKVGDISILDLFCSDTSFIDLLCGDTFLLNLIII